MSKIMEDLGNCKKFIIRKIWSPIGEMVGDNVSPGVLGRPSSVNSIAQAVRTYWKG